MNVWYDSEIYLPLSRIIKPGKTFACMTQHPPLYYGFDRLRLNSLLITAFPPLTQSSSSNLTVSRHSPHLHRHLRHAVAPPQNKSHWPHQTRPYQNHPNLPICPIPQTHHATKSKVCQLGHVRQDDYRVMTLRFLLLTIAITPAS